MKARSVRVLCPSSREIVKTAKMTPSARDYSRKTADTASSAIVNDTGICKCSAAMLFFVDVAVADVDVAVPDPVRLVDVLVCPHSPDPSRLNVGKKTRGSPWFIGTTIVPFLPATTVMLHVVTSVRLVPGSAAPGTLSWYDPPWVPWFDKTETICTPLGPLRVAYVDGSVYRIELKFAT
jgi:hypothetical protein